MLRFVQRNGLRTGVLTKRSFQSSASSNAKVVMALYEDPVTGYPPASLRDDLPVIEKYPDGQTLPTPQSKNEFKPGDLLGCVSGELGLRKFLEDRGHTLVVTSDKDGEGSVLEKELVDADIVISQVRCCHVKHHTKKTLLYSAPCS